MKNCFNCGWVSKITVEGKVREVLCLYDPSPYFEVAKYMCCDYWMPQENVVYPITFKGKPLQGDLE
jgi:hypothetical protein